MIRLAAAASIVVFALATPAHANDPASEPPGSPPPLEQYYPDRAQRMNVEGLSHIRCTVTGDGRLTDCRVIDEKPVDFGFGDASVAMAEHEFKVSPYDRLGRHVGGGEIRLTIHWKLPKEPSPPQPPQPTPPQGQPVK